MSDYTQEQREQAAVVLENASAFSDKMRSAMDLAISVLREPAQGWVSTSERVPTAEDARGHRWIPSAKYIKYDNAWKVCLAAYSTVNRANTDCFLPWPPLPDVPHA